MFELKPISHASVASSLAKAERYRLLNEPAEAESICRDILEIEPDNQAALATLVLALSDQIQHDPRAFPNALQTIVRLQQPYDRAYFGGIAWERRSKAHHQAGGRGPHTVYEWVIEALRLFEQAELLRPPGNDDAVLRWNACVRFLARHPGLSPRPEEIPEPILSE